MLWKFVEEWCMSTYFGRMVDGRMEWNYISGRAALQKGIKDNSGF
jgi:hypothetical protein